MHEEGFKRALTSVLNAYGLKKGYIKPDDKVSGLKDAVRVLDGVKDIAICRLTAADVVRHALVQEIISAYERSAQKKEVKKPTRQIQGRYHQRKN